MVSLPLTRDKASATNKLSMRSRELRHKILRCRLEVAIGRAATENSVAIAEM